MRRVAVIGSGISGMSAAHLLSQTCNVTLYEAHERLGGHTATVDVEVGSGRYAIDTGFIVFNDWTYPRFLKLLDKLGLAKQATEMSFSVKNPLSGLEYNGHSIDTLFAQRRNLINPRFYRFIFEILRFNKLAISRAEQGFSKQDESLADFLQQHQFSEYFSHNYILPMIAAIWSSSVADAKDFPLQFFLQFFLNHGLLNVTDRPQWYVVPGGSRSYIAPLTDSIADIRLNCPVQRVIRDGQGVQVITSVGADAFDEVIFACHSDQALAILGDDASGEEKQILGQMAYRENSVILHTDSSVLPSREKAWASWNYDLGSDLSAPPTVTYNMNILQGIDAPEVFCVSLNAQEKINPAQQLAEFRYAHPVMNAAMINAQQQRERICGRNNTHFCGAYWYNGFHEDGLRSACDVARRFGVEFE